MAQLTLVLPFALPAPEFAADLTKALQAPGLAALLSRTSSQTRQPADTAVRALPHELWLADTLGLRQHGRPAFASAAMRGFGLDPADGTWFIVHPAHIEIARSHLLMPDLRQLALGEEEARSLFDAARESFAEAGHELLYGDATTWFMRADHWAGMDTASPDYAVGMNLNDCMPEGEHARAYRKLQNEVQMLWYTHPVNAAREARRQAPVNAFWLWGGASDAAERQPGAELVVYESPGWLAGRKLTQLPGIASAIKHDTLLVCGNVAGPAIAADWSAWLAQMHQLEADLFAPLLDALKRGAMQQVRLVLANRTALAEFTTTAMAQRKFWRRPTLENLK
ncbi:MAG TPA: hypothetical protein VNT33_07535 [Telluria sp.]|nr:hypothetical protein [Telluria sp.]